MSISQTSYHSAGTRPHLCVFHSYKQCTLPDSGVVDMKEMFFGATIFNQNIGNWNVSNVRTMDEMFNGASEFNSDIGNWITSSVTNMDYMFKDALIFDKNISNWCVTNISSEPPGFSLNSLLTQEKKVDQNFYLN